MQLADVPAASEDDMKPLTPVQKTVLDLIRRHIAKYGRPPSIRELSAKRGVNINATAYTLMLLERKGHIKRSYGKARAIELTDRPGIPLVTLENYVR
jgi:SOS-response transcriptional repressor LexA